MEGNEDGFLQINHSGQEPCEHVACALDGDDGSDDGDDDEDDNDHDRIFERNSDIEHVACTLGDGSDDGSNDDGDDDGHDRIFERTSYSPH